MVVIHRITIRPTEKQRSELEALGVTLQSGLALPGGGAPYVAFDVRESHPNWNALARLFREWDTGDFVITRFSLAEVLAAKWLVLVPDGHHGYPQPEEDFGFLAVTYDLSDWCAECGMGRKQKAPFRMKGEPKWGRRGILQLNWVYDELFATPDAWTRVFKPAGVACRPVLNVRGVELKRVVQLVLEATVGVITDGLAFERCERCARTRYLPVTRGAFPALRGVPTTSIVRTAECFGSGAQADQRVLISQDLARALTAGGVRGASFKPVAV